MDFPQVKDCRFLKPNTDLKAELPNFIFLDRSKKVLSFSYKHRVYSLGITKDGLLAGFRGAIKPEKKAEILIIRDGEGFAVIDQRGENFMPGKERAQVPEWAKNPIYQALQKWSAPTLPTAPLAAYFGGVSFDPA